MMVTELDISHAVKFLREGKLVAFPTETVYGLGADASNPEAVAKIFAAKGRPVDHPVIVHLADFNQLKNWVREVNSHAEKLAKHFWPGPLTLILPRAAHVHNNITGGQNTIGIRIPSHPIAQRLLHAFGNGIAAPSANRFGRISPTHAEHVKQELDNRVDLILDGGECDIGVESTIVDVSGQQPCLLRPGMITASQLSAVLGEPISTHIHQAPRASGMLENHYAPETALQIVTTENLVLTINQFLAVKKNIGVLARQQPLLKNPHLYWTVMPEQAENYAHQLYHQLRLMDKKNIDIILVEAVPINETWSAIADRLQKAAGKKYYE